MPTNQLAVSYIVDWSTFGLDNLWTGPADSLNLPTANFY